MVDARALAFAAGAIALWSTNAVVARSVLAEVPVALVQFLQFSGATLFFAAMQLGSPRTSGRRESLTASALMIGVVGLVGTMVLQYIAFATAPVIEANLVAYTWPLLAVAGVILLGRTRRPALLAAAALAGFLGAGVVISGGDRGLDFGGNVAGYIAAFGSAACMAFYTVAGAKLSIDPDRLLLPSAVLGSFLTLAWVIADGATAAWSAAIPAALYLGAGPMGLGYWFWQRAVASDPQGRVAVFGYLTPILSTTLLIAAGERLAPQALVGAILVVASCAIVGIGRQERASHVR
jgi:drug/metabolite transporter (DMT)-like permease